MKLLNIILGHITLQLSKKHVISSVIDLSNIHFTVFFASATLYCFIGVRFHKVVAT